MKNSHKFMELVDMLDYYSLNFCKKTCMIETEYIPLSEIQIVFNETGFPHLIGLHYVTKGSATKNVNNIKNKNITIQTISKHKDYKKIRYRIEGFFSLSNMLISPGSNVCILAKDLKCNSMNLDVILFDEFSSNSVMILGLRRAKDSQIFYPTTLHKTSKNKYKNHRMTKIKNITWI